jgi:hypothetical protein
MAVMGALVGDELRQLCGRSKVLMASASDGLMGGVGLRAMLEAGRQKFHGRRLFVMANIIEFFSCAVCVPLIMMWSFDLLASLFTNGQEIQTKQ